MNKNAYLAELTQLLYYMTDWDRDAAVEECRQRFDSCDDPEEIVRVLGSPMKLAVTLHRTYQPTPEPAEGESVPSPLPPMPEPEMSAPPPAEETVPEPDTAPEAEAPVSPEEPPAPVQPEAEESAPEPEMESLEEILAEAEEPEVPAPAPIQEETPPVPTRQTPVRPEPREEIFSEIFNAATMAQSAIVMSTDDQTTTAPAEKARLGVLIPYTVACVLIGVPVTVVLFAVDLLIFGIAVAALVSGVYFLTFLPQPQFVLPGDKLVIIGLSILFVTAAAAICVLGVWFVKNATLGFPRFLLEFGKKHGYAKEETP